MSTVQALRREGSRSVGKEILAVICPEWRSAALVLNAHGGTVVFANWHCINLLARGGPAYLVGERLLFRMASLNRRFQAEIARLVVSGAENAFVIERDPASGGWTSVTIRNGQGFFRDALERSLDNSASEHLMIVEIAMGDNRPDPGALAAFAKAALLSSAETELVEALASGHSLSSVAGTRGVAVSTIRQRMKSVLGKTGCRRQAELVHLVLSLCPLRPA